MFTADIALFQPALGTAAQAILTPQGGRAAFGVEKLAQRFVMVFLTQIGSIPYRANEGTVFPTALLGGNMMTEMDIYSLFYQSLQQIGVVLQSYETSSDPDNERYASAQITQLTIEADGASVELQITSLAGTVAGLVLPLLFG